MTTETTDKPLTLSALPALKQPLADGTFAGVITLPDGTHHAVVLLAERPTQRLTWAKAGEWAKKVGGQLPSRLISMLLFATCRDLIEADWYWTDETHGSSYAWYCGFDDGYVDYDYRSSEGAAVAVRLIPLAP